MNSRGRVLTALAAVRQLFCTELNYDHASAPLACRDWSDRARDALAEAPAILARHESQFGAFDVIHARLSPEQRGRGFPLSLTEREIAIVEGR